MIEITICKRNQQYAQLHCIGHAGYAEEGQDIVCAGASMLVLNTLNAIEAFASQEMEIKKVDETTGQIDVRFGDTVTEQTKLLMDTLCLGLECLEDNYGEDYISLIFEEV